MKRAVSTRCTTCGSNEPEGAVFCTQCGSTIGNVGATVNLNTTTITRPNHTARKRKAAAVSAARTFFKGLQKRWLKGWIIMLHVLNRSPEAIPFVIFIVSLFMGYCISTVLPLFHMSQTAGMILAALFAYRVYKLRVLNREWTLILAILSWCMTCAGMLMFL